jgi:phospholipid/cholesterol/gamma-HCH transport system substrate-binding protein
MNTSTHREIRDVVVGLGVTAAMVVLLVLVFGPNLFSRTSTYEVHAAFGRTDGLNIGSPVQAAGVTVGEVTALELIGGFRVQATMRINTDVELDSDATASIVTDGIFGGEEMIEDGGAISFTEDALVLDDLLSLIISQAHAKRSAREKESGQ